MIYFKACPRCEGDMHTSGDQYGRFLECLQCGYEADAKDNDTRNTWQSPSLENQVELEVA